MGSVRQDLDIDSLWALADAVADAARVETLRYFRTAGLVADSKAAHFDPVTAADRASETAMRALIEAHRPDDGILGEEFGTKPSRSGLTWVLDPIDGTRSYISGTPTWGVLVALMDERGPFLGIIDQPYIRERFSGGLGRADVLGPQGRAPLKTRPARPLSDATIFTTFPEVGTEAEGRAFHAVARHARLTRYGTYDVAAPIAVIEAAGGVVTDWTGAPAHGGGRIIAAANAAIHAEALAILKDSLS